MRRWLTMDYLSWSRHFRNMPGQGDLPLAEFAEAIHAHRLSGLLVARDIQRPVSRRLGHGVARGRVPFAAAPAGPSGVAAARADQAPPMPSRANVDGVEFIEFAASDEEAQALGTHARGAGLRADCAPSPQGRHALAAGRHQYRHQLRAGRISRTASTPCMAPRFARSACA